MNNLRASNNLRISIHNDEVKKEIEEGKFNIGLSDHILHLKSFIDESTCKKIINKLDQIKEVDKSEVYTDGLLNNQTDSFYDLSINEIDQIKNQVFNLGLEEYSNKVRAFNWSYHKTGNLYMTEMIVRRYQKESEFRYHYDDIIDEIFPKWFGSRKSILTCNVYLNENTDYTGGDLYFASCDKTYRPSIGDIILSPPNWLFYHTVKPVLSGVRYSGTFWIYYAPSEAPLRRGQFHSKVYSKRD